MKTFEVYCETFSELIQCETIFDALLDFLHKYPKAEIIAVENRTMIETKHDKGEVKTFYEIHRAHDVINMAICDELPIHICAEHKTVLTANLDALCWVLNHDNDELQKNLKVIMDEMEQKGFHLERKPE